MTQDVVGCRADDPSKLRFAKMREGQFRRMPVFDADGKPLGVVTLSDLAKQRRQPGRNSPRRCASLSEPHRRRALRLRTPTAEPSRAQRGHRPPPLSADLYRMTLQQGLAFAVIIGMMGLFVWGRLRYDVVGDAGALRFGRSSASFRPRRPSPASATTSSSSSARRFSSAPPSRAPASWRWCSTGSAPTSPRRAR